MNLNVSNNLFFLGRHRKYFVDEPQSKMNVEKSYIGASELTDTSLKLMKGLSDQFELDWKLIKENKLMQSSPYYIIPTKNNNTISFEPLYGSNKPEILMEVDGGKYRQRFIFDRKNPRNFRYEKIVMTDYGYGTVKTFNSMTQTNPEIMKLANTYINDNVVQILDDNIIKDYFEHKILT